MRRLAFFVLLLLIIPSSLVAQGRYGGRDRYRYFNDNSFEITPFVGYTWGGTIYSGQTTTFLGQNADVASSANFGVNLGIPIQPNGLKVELMADHQATNFTTGSSGLFGPSNRLGDFDITYYHAGVLVPFAQSYSATPYVIGSAGVATLDPRMSGVSSSTRFSASAGIGVKIPIQSHAGFRGEIRGFYTSLPNDTSCRICNYTYSRDLFQGQANLGLYFKF